MNYEFDTEFIDVACNLVGHALPYRFAYKAAKTCLNALEENCLNTSGERHGGE
jgi:hypothetical protein